MRTSILLSTLHGPLKPASPEQTHAPALCAASTSRLGLTVQQHCPCHLCPDAGFRAAIVSTSARLWHSLVLSPRPFWSPEFYLQKTSARLQRRLRWGAASGNSPHLNHRGLSGAPARRALGRKGGTSQGRRALRGGASGHATKSVPLAASLGPGRTPQPMAPSCHPVSRMGRLANARSEPSAPLPRARRSARP